MTTIIYRRDRKNERHYISADSRCTEGTGIWSEHFDKVYICEYFIASLGGSQKIAVMFERLEKLIRSKEHGMAKEAELTACDLALEDIDDDILEGLDELDEDSEILIPVTSEHIADGYRSVAESEGIEIREGQGIPFRIRSKDELLRLVETSIQGLCVDEVSVIIAFRGSDKAYNIDINAEEGVGIVEVFDDVMFLGTGAWVAKAVYPYTNGNLTEVFTAVSKIDTETNNNVITKYIKY